MPSRKAMKIGTWSGRRATDNPLKATFQGKRQRQSVKNGMTRNLENILFLINSPANIHIARLYGSSKLPESTDTQRLRLLNDLFGKIKTDTVCTCSSRDCFLYVLKEFIKNGGEAMLSLYLYERSIEIQVEALRMASFFVNFSGWRLVCGGETIKFQGSSDKVEDFSEYLKTVFLSYKSSYPRKIIDLLFEILLGNVESLNLGILAQDIVNSWMIPVIFSTIAHVSPLDYVYILESVYLLLKTNSFNSKEFFSHSMLLEFISILVSSGPDISFSTGINMFSRQNESLSFTSFGGRPSVSTSRSRSVKSSIDSKTEEGDVKLYCLQKKICLISFIIVEAAFLVPSREMFRSLLRTVVEVMLKAENFSGHRNVDNYVRLILYSAFSLLNSQYISKAKIFFQKSEVQVWANLNELYRILFKYSIYGKVDGIRINREYKLATSEVSNAKKGNVCFALTDQLRFMDSIIFKLAIDFLKGPVKLINEELQAKSHKSLQENSIFSSSRSLEGNRIVFESLLDYIDAVETSKLYNIDAAHLKQISAVIARNSSFTTIGNMKQSISKKESNLTQSFLSFAYAVEHSKRHSKEGIPPMILDGELPISEELIYSEILEIPEEISTITSDEKIAELKNAFNHYVRPRRSLFTTPKGLKSVMIGESRNE